MKILVTGAAGFIGSQLIKNLIKDNHEVVGLDNINSYYDPTLKLARLQDCGICNTDILEDFPWNKLILSSEWGTKYRFIRLNIEEFENLQALFVREKFDIVIHLAAQAGVRYSINNPRAYIKSNIDAFLNVLEACRMQPIKHLIYASSSSVYGLNGKIPLTESQSIAHPVSLYAATKKSDELMAHVYSHLFGLPTTGLRFFTVYGPWGRPDMSPYLFIDAIIHDRPINVFNNGDMWRDFTYIDDITEGISRIVNIIPKGDKSWDELNPNPAYSKAPYQIYNIGNQNPTRLNDYISCIENILGRTAVKNYLPMQPGDVYRTYADSTALSLATGFTPSTTLEIGISKTVKWFKDYYKL